MPDINYKRVVFFIENPKKGKKYIKLIKFIQLQKRRFIKFLKFFYKKEYFNYFYLRFYEIISLKKPKPNS